MTPPSTNPRSVTPGIETHKPVELEDGRVINLGRELPPLGLYVGLDWLRLTGPEAIRDSVESFVHERFPRDEPSIAGGAKWFDFGVCWHPGIVLSWGHRASICQIDLRGERLQGLDGGARVEILRQLVALGLKPTRIDCAVDWIGLQTTLCVDASASCRLGELCIARKYRVGDEFTADGVATGRYLAIGSRESPTFVRIYDKGLERGVAPAGHWERFEAEWKGERAAAVSAMLLTAGDDWPQMLAATALASVDFRVSNGRSELDRRPQRGWWTDLLDGLTGVRIHVAMREPEFERWLQAFRTSYAQPIVDLAADCRRPLYLVIACLFAGLAPKGNHRARQPQFKEDMLALIARCSPKPGSESERQNDCDCLQTDASMPTR